MTTLFIPVLLASVVTAMPVSAPAPTVSVQKLDVSVDQGVVTLHGTVDSPTQKKFAGHLARKPGGVAQVKNQIAVVPR